MYKLRLRFNVDVDVVGNDQEEAWARLSMVKHHLTYATSSGISKEDRDSVKKFSTIHGATTDLILKEETWIT